MHSKRIYFAAAVVLLNLNVATSAVYFVDPAGTQVVQYSAYNRPCTVHYDRHFIQNILNKSYGGNVIRVDSNILNQLSSSCRNTNQLNKTLGPIFPGTKWCGPGSIATAYNDLGVYAIEDMCCREHDHCPNTLEPGQCRHGICNISPFPRLHCDCDERLKNCLLAANSDIANIIGTIYFNIAQKVCIRERRSCPPYMRNNLSYSWFCEEWKFLPFDRFTPIKVQIALLNQIPRYEEEVEKGSKIDAGLKTIFQQDEDFSKIMNKTS